MKLIVSWNNVKNKYDYTRENWYTKKLEIIVVEGLNAGNFTSNLGYFYDGEEKWNKS
jgi:hypothetical protein